MSNHFFEGFMDEVVKLAGSMGKAQYDENGKYIGFKKTMDIAKPKPMPSQTAAQQKPAPAPAPAAQQKPAQGNLQKGVNAVNNNALKGGSTNNRKSLKREGVFGM